jgi:hypothetical protein
MVPFHGFYDSAQVSERPDEMIISKRLLNAISSFFAGKKEIKFSDNPATQKSYPSLKEHSDVIYLAYFLCGS